MKHHNKQARHDPLHVHAMMAILTSRMWNPIRDSFKQTEPQWRKSSLKSVDCAILKLVNSQG